MARPVPPVAPATKACSPEKFPEGPRMSRSLSDVMGTTCAHSMCHHKKHLNLKGSLSQALLYEDPAASLGNDTAASLKHSSVDAAWKP